VFAAGARERAQSAENLKKPAKRRKFLHIPLDLEAKACNNLKVPSGRVGGCSCLAEVRLQEGESLENALRRFKRKVQTEDIIKEVKRHSFYLKPGERKRVKEALARKRSRKKARKEQD
jgi:small subunit ribosomal protein S21